MVERLSAWAVCFAPGSDKVRFHKALMFRDGTHASGCVSAIGVCHVDSAPACLRPALKVRDFAPSSALRDPLACPPGTQTPIGISWGPRRVPRRAALPRA